MAKGAGCTPEFRAKAVGLLTESRGSCSSETRAVDQVAGDPGVAPETLRCVLSSCYRPVWREFSFRKSGRF